MSSIESMVLELEEEYNRITADFEKYIASLSPTPTSTKNHQKELYKLLGAVTSLQTRIQYDLEFAEKIAKGTKYFPRLSSMAQSIIDKLESEKDVEKVPKSVFSDLYHRHDYFDLPDELSSKGIVPTLRLAYDYLIHYNWSEMKLHCEAAAFVFKRLSINLPELEADMRLVGWLTAFPLDKKIALKNRLKANGFQGVVVSLEQAESNLEDGYSQEGHCKDCISRSRDAVENFMATARFKETNEKTENNFRADTKKLVDIGLYDEETGRLAQGVYSFCSSDLGSHKFETKKNRH